MDLEHLSWGIQKKNEGMKAKGEKIPSLTHTHKSPRPRKKGTVNSALTGVPQQHVHGRSSVGSYAPRIGEVPSKDTLSDITCVKIECREADASVV